MKQQWICETCEQIFDNELDCSIHEKGCNKIITHICDKCEKIESYNIKNKPLWVDERWHEINLGRMGYGSRLDGCDVDFILCDDCLVDFIDSFTNKDKIHNSGSRYYYYGDN